MKELNKEIIVLSLAGLVLIIYISLVLAAPTPITSITLNNPADNAFKNGTIILNASLPSGENASSASFWNSTDGVDWDLICTDSTEGENFSCSWGTSGYNQNLVQIKVNATNGTDVIEDVSYGITIDNTPSVLADIKNTSVAETSVIIVWNTTETFSGSGSNSTVDYGINTDLDNKSDNFIHSTAHSISLTGLIEGTTYYYNVTSCDKSGNYNTSSIFNFNTLSIPPIISSETSSPADTNALITWTTHEYSNSTVEYGISINLGSLEENTTNTTSHFINLTGLTNGSTYYYNVTSCDWIGNCNTTGPYDFITGADLTPPNVTNPLVNGSTYIEVKINELLNITANVEDNMEVDSVWAQITKSDGTTTQSMTQLSGTMYGGLYNSSLSGTHNVTVYANDTNGNVGNSTQRNWTAFGYFSVAPNFVRPYKNFTFGGISRLNITITNQNNITENYSIKTNMTNTTGWNITTNASNMQIPSLQSQRFELVLTGPMNASYNVTVQVNITSSETSYLNRSYYTFMTPVINITGLPDQTVVSNITHVTTNITKFLNFTGINYSGEVDNLHGIIGENQTRVDCSLYLNETTGPSTFIKTGTFNKSSGTCTIDVGSGVTLGNTYYLNVLVNVTGNNHWGRNRALVGLPASVNNITVGDMNATPGASFKITGTARYDSGQLAADLDNVNGSFDNSSCLGSSPGGIIGYYCIAPITPGTYNMSINVSGMWNTSGVGYALLTVRNLSEPVESEGVVLSASVDDFILIEEENYTFWVTIKNKYLATKVFSPSIYEMGTYKHFDLEYNSSITIPKNESRSMKVEVVPYKYLKEGTFYIAVSIPSENINKTITVYASGYEMEDEEINVNRYFETTGSVTRIGLNITNTKYVSVEFEITERIPKSIANDVADISFYIQPNLTIEADPIVLWNVILHPNNSTLIEYNVTGSIKQEDFGAATTTVIDFFLPPGAGEGEEVEAEAGGEDPRLIYVAIIFIITIILVIIILFKGEALGIKKKPRPAFLREKEEMKEAEGMDFGESLPEKKKKKEFRWSE